MAVIEVTLRALAAFALSAVLALSGCTAAESPIPLGSAPSPETSPTAEPPATESPAPPTPEPTEPPPTFLPDHYPPELVGRPFYIRPIADSEARVLGRIGLPERLQLTADQRVLGIVGDRVVTAVPASTGSRIQILSFAGGGRIGDPIIVPSGLQPYGIAGDFVLANATGVADDVVAGVASISTVDGSVHKIVPDQSTNKPNPTRIVIVSADGTELVTSVCATNIDFVGNCSAATLIEIGTGATLGTVDLRGGQPIDLSSDGILAFWLDHVALFTRSGQLRWASDRWTDTDFLQNVIRLPDGGLVAVVLRAGDGLTWRFLGLDSATGQTQLLAKTKIGPPNIELFLAPRRLVLAESGSDGRTCWDIACGPDDPHVLDASILDLTSGDLVRNSIHVNLTP